MLDEPPVDVERDEAEALRAQRAAVREAVVERRGRLPRLARARAARRVGLDIRPEQALPPVQPGMAERPLAAASIPSLGQKRGLSTPRT